MINKKIELVIMVLLFGVLITSCASNLGNFSVISTKNIDWSRASEFTRNNQRVEGGDKSHIIICIPTKPNITIEEAVDKALQDITGAVALVDVVIGIKKLYIPFIYGRINFFVEGNVLFDPKLALTDENQTNYIVFYTVNRNDFIKMYVSESEYLDFFK